MLACARVVCSIEGVQLFSWSVLVVSVHYTIRFFTVHAHASLNSVAVCFSDSAMIPTTMWEFGKREIILM